ncbi:MAG: allophanate hydrolase, partial [Neisseriaceae bacterium]|nr:allophanate hydrolase [Neisseriaceae bacterium]
AIKDNIDLKDIPTTAGCPEYAYVPKESATVVQRLIDAGAIPIGKTNLDQFATGLNGTRSPYGVCHNAFNFYYISGGSSSGSAVAVALGLVSFSFGTDTAGSGRVPACFNGLIGVKPTRGLLSNKGLVPACKSLDCISIFAYSSAEANTVLSVVDFFDAQDSYSRHNPYDNNNRHYGVHTGSLKIGIIQTKDLKFFGDKDYQEAYQRTLDVLIESGIELVEIPYQNFDEAAKLLYEGPWVSERYVACGEFIEQHPDSVNPVVAEIIKQGKNLLSTDLFRAEYRLQALKQKCYELLPEFDCLLFTTAGKLFTISELEEEPVLYNSHLGYYTNFLNLLDLSAVAVPTVKTEKELPFGITLVVGAFRDRYLLSITRRLEKLFNLSIQEETPKTIMDKRYIPVAVCGAHLKGLPLNWQLLERGAVLLEETKTAAKYRMYLLENNGLLRPGLVFDENNGQSIDIEIWNVPRAQFGSFVDDVFLPFGIGKVQTIDGRWVNGFICEGYIAESSQEITQFGSWKKYMAQR